MSTLTLHECIDGITNKMNVYHQEHLQIRSYNFLQEVQTMNNYPNPEYKCLLKLIKQHCNFIYCTDKTMVTFGIDKITFKTSIMAISCECTVSFNCTPTIYLLINILLYKLTYLVGLYFLSIVVSNYDSCDKSFSTQTGTMS